MSHPFDSSWASILGVLPGIFVPALIFVWAWRELFPQPESRWWFLVGLGVWFVMTLGLCGLRLSLHEHRSWLIPLLGGMPYMQMSATLSTISKFANSLAVPMSAIFVLMAFVTQAEKGGLRRGVFVVLVSIGTGWLVGLLCAMPPRFDYYEELFAALGYQSVSRLNEYVHMGFPNWGSATGWLICYAALRERRFLSEA